MARRDEADHERIAAIRRQLVELADELERLESKYADDDTQGGRPRLTLINGGLAAMVAVPAAAAALIRAHPRRLVAVGATLVATAAAAAALMPSAVSTPPGNPAAIPPGIAVPASPGRPATSALPQTPPPRRRSSLASSAPGVGAPTVPSTATPWNTPWAAVPTRPRQSLPPGTGVPSAPIRPIAPPTTGATRPSPVLSVTAGGAPSPCVVRLELPGLLNVCAA